MIRRFRPVIAAVLTVYTLAAGLSLFALGEPGGESGVEWLYIVPVLIAAAVGLFLSIRRPDNAVGTVISVTGAALVTNGLMNMIIPEAAAAGSDLEATLTVLIGDLAWTVQMLCTLVLLPLWFPTGSAINLRWAWVGRIAIIFSAVAWVAFAVGDTVCVDYAAPESSVCVDTRPIPWAVAAVPGAEMLIAVSMVMAIPAIVSVFVRLRRSHGVEREQLKLVLFAVSLVALGILLSFDIWGVPRWINDSVNAMALAGVWVAIAVAIVRYKLYDIDRIISRTVSYVLLLALLGLVIFGLVALLAIFLPSDDPLVVALATLAAFALFTPLRRRVQTWVDRRFNRSRYDAERVADEFAGSLRDRVDAEEIAADWVTTISATMQPATVGLWLKAPTP